MTSSKSVGYRLSLLVAIQTAVALLLVLVSVRTLAIISADYRHMYNFQFRSVAALGRANLEANRLKPHERSAALDTFYWRYRKEWETASGTSEAAIQFRKDLERLGVSDMSRVESEALSDLGRSLNEEDVEGIRRNLAELYRVNVRFAMLKNEDVMQRMKNGRFWVILIGIIGTGLILFLGLWVRGAIGPRIKRLVTNVQNFRTTGTHERISDQGKDDIAVLANALDVGFSSIVSRQREREQFLSIAAHELKTPLTSIYGYASLLLRRPQLDEEVHRALRVINRQSWRLTRLVDALFLGLQAKSGKLDFEPEAFNMSALIDRVLLEMEPFLPNKSFGSQIDRDICILGDEAMLEHALWSVITCAFAMSAEKVPLHIAFFTIDNRARLTITITGGKVSVAEVEELFMPFHFIEFETGDSGVRSAVGLYLCREIVRLHSGALRVEDLAGLKPEIVMELPT